MASGGQRRGSSSSSRQPGVEGDRDGPGMTAMRREFWRDTEVRSESFGSLNRSNGSKGRPLPIPPPIRTGPNPAPASAAAPQAVTDAGDPDRGEAHTLEPIQEANAAAGTGHDNRAYLKQSSTLSSISQDDFAPHFDSQRQNPQHTASRSRSVPKVSKAAPTPPQPPQHNSNNANAKPLNRQGSAPGNAGIPQHASNSASANARRTGLAKLSQAGQELYINQLKTLLTEAKEELKKRHRIIDVQKRRLDKAEESRGRARTLFEELIEKVRVEVEQQEMLTVQLNQANSTVEELQHKVAELEYLREQAVGLDSSNMREIMAERSAMQEAVTHLRAELDRKEEEAAQQVEELEQRYEASQRHVSELNARLHTLADSLEEAHKARDHDRQEMARLRAEADKGRAVTAVSEQLSASKSAFLSRLRRGIPVLKHGRQGKPKPRVLTIDDKGEVLCCKEEGSGDKDYYLHVQGMQVVVGRISKALQRSPASSQDRCFSLVSAKPGGLLGSPPPTPSTTGSGATPTTTTSTSTGRRGSFLFGGGDKDKDKDKAYLDLELTSEASMSVEELVAGLRLLGAAGGMDMVEVVMRRTSITASGGVLAALSPHGDKDA